MRSEKDIRECKVEGIPREYIIKAHQMTADDIINDLNEIKAYFIETTGGSYPEALDKAIEYIKASGGETT